MWQLKDANIPSQRYIEFYERKYIAISAMINHETYRIFFYDNS